MRPHRDAEQPAGVYAVGMRAGAVPAGLGSMMMLRNGTGCAPLVEVGDDRGVPGAAAGGPDVLAQFQGPVERPETNHFTGPLR